MEKTSKALLIFAILFALVTRFWQLGTIPYPPDGDEIAFGYYGWSLLHFGTDEYGQFLPTSFTSIGDNKYPTLPYLNIIPAALFGLTNFETRFISAMSGVLLVLLVYFLTKILFKNTKAAVFSAWAVALSPWGIIVSRLGYEVFVPVVISTAGFVFLLFSQQVKTKKNWLLSISLTLLALSLFTHASTRFFVPAFLFVWALLRPRKIIFGFFIFLSLITMLMFLLPNSGGRAAEDLWKGITAEEQNRLEQIYVGAGTSQIKLPARITWLLNNKYKIAVFDFINRYAEHFSISYLFTQGEDSGQAIPDMGVLLFIDIILLPAGLIYLIKSRDKTSGILIIAWALIAPIPSSLTTGIAKMDRTALMLVPLSIISALGFVSITDNFKKQKLTYLLISAVIVSALYALNQIFIIKPMDKPWTKQEVNEQLTKDILNLKDKYQAVVTPEDDYIFFLFYGKISPQEFLRKSQLVDSKWNRVARLDNIYFNMPYKCPKGGKLEVLYVCQGVEVPQNAKVVKAYYYPDEVAAYSLIEFYPTSQMPDFDNLPKLPDKFHYMKQVEDLYPDGVIPQDNKSYW